MCVSTCTHMYIINAQRIAYIYTLLSHVWSVQFPSEWQKNGRHYLEDVYQQQCNDQRGAVERQGSREYIAVIAACTQINILQFPLNFSEIERSRSPSCTYIYIYIYISLAFVFDKASCTLTRTHAYTCNLSYLTLMSGELSNSFVERHISSSVYVTNIVRIIVVYTSMRTIRLLIRVSVQRKKGR